MTATQIQEVRQASDIKKIEELIQGIIGELCWGTRLSYGNEFRLEIGRRLPDPILTGKEKGSWTLGTRASGWLLNLSNKPLVASSDDLASIKQKIHLVEGNRISAFKIERPKLGLVITFGNDMRFKILPSWDDDSKLAHWELFMPNSMLLQVGPKATWSYHRSDVPMSKLKSHKGSS